MQRSTFLLVAVFLATAPVLSAQSLRDHYAQTSTPSEGLGRSVALNGKYMLAGRPGFNGSRGDVVVFDTVSGRQLRVLTPPPADQQTGDEFGFAVALRGDEAVISAPGDTTGVPSGTGSIYFFDLRSGRLRHKLAGPGGYAHYGYALAAEGRYVVAGAPASPNGGVSRGIAVVITNTPGDSDFTVTELLASVLENGARHGESVAVHGKFVAVGSPYCDNPGAEDSGRVFVFDLSFPSPSATAVSAPAPVADARFGWAIGLTGDSLVVASQTGAISMHNYAGVLKGNTAVLGNISSLAVSGRLIAVGTPTVGSVAAGQGFVNILEALPYAGSIPNLLQVTPQLGLVGNEFCGTSVALHGDILATGAPGRQLHSVAGGATVVGSILTARPLAVPLQRNIIFPGLREVVTSGDSAPNRDGATVRAPLELALGTIAGENNMMLNLALAGRNTTGGRGQLWTVENRALISLRQSRETNVSSGLIQSFSSPVANVPGAFATAVTLTGPDITTDNTAFLGSNGTSVTEVFRKGVMLFGVGRVRSYQPPRQANVGGFPNYASVLALQSAFTETVTPGDDSAVRFVNQMGTGFALIHEGNPSPFGENYGQVGPWVSFEGRYAVFPAKLAASSATNAGLVKFDASTLSSVPVARKGDVAAGVPGALFKTFASAQANDYSTGEVSFRATLQRAPGSPPGLNTTNNEGLFRFLTSATTLILRKGVPPPGLPTGFPRVKRLLKHWIITSNGSTRALVQLSGPGVTAANDLALLEVNTSGTLTTVLLREGDYAPGCATARIGVMHRVDANQSEGYTVLLSLVTGPGAATGADNLALYGRPTISSIPVQPSLLLRKGMRVQRSSSTFATLSSFAFSKNVNDPTGATASGLPHAIGEAPATVANPVTVGVIATWTDRSQSALAVSSP